MARNRIPKTAPFLDPVRCRRRRRHRQWQSGVGAVKWRVRRWYRKMGFGGRRILRRHRRRRQARRSHRQRRRRW